MKKHLTFLKGASLMSLAIAALFGTCLTLTSCGSGGGDNADTPAEQAAEYMENKTLELHMNGVCCYVNLSERMQGTSILDAQVKYGNGSPVIGNLIVVKATMSEENLETARIKVTTNTGSISGESDFKNWWGVASGEGNLVFSGDTYVDLTVTNTTSGGCTGTFDAVTVTVTTDENGTETETEKSLTGAFFKLSQ